MPQTEWISAVVTGLAVVTTAETVVATLPSVSTDGPSRRIELLAEVDHAVGASSTGVTLRIRRGTDATGTVVGVVTNEGTLAAAGTYATYTIEAVDTPGEVAGQAYVATVADAGATGNGAVNKAILTARMV